jgi:hypothetical protein
LLKRLGRRRRRRNKGKGPDRERERVVLICDDAAEGVAGYRGYVVVVCKAKRSRGRSARGLRKKREGEGTEVAQGGGKGCGQEELGVSRPRTRGEEVLGGGARWQTGRGESDNAGCRALSAAVGFLLAVFVTVVMCYGVSQNKCQLTGSVCGVIDLGGKLRGMCNWSIESEGCRFICNLELSF